MPRLWLLLLAGLSPALTPLPRAAEATYGAEIDFLQRHVGVVELSAPDGRSRLVVIPAYEGRVMTSTAAGRDGYSFGWINHRLIATGQLQPHMNVFGGEERIWLGPEGGPFALFFPPHGREQTLATWQTPPLFDTAPWRVERQSPDAVELSASGRLTNRAGSVLDVGIVRTVRLLGAAEAAAALGGHLPAGLSWVGYESNNRLTNRGSTPWRRETGLPSIWLLGQFNPGPRTIIMVPMLAGSPPPMSSPSADRPAVRSDYFGAIAGDRLRQQMGAVYFRADGKSRGKIGVAAAWARPIVGSWDAAHGVLTLIEFNLPPSAAHLPYVDSRWLDSAAPYAGDAVNAYNDGPPAPGVPPLGPFYELETSSPAAELKPGESLVHISRTFHFTGEHAALEHLARARLGRSLEAIEAALR